MNSTHIVAARKQNLEVASFGVECFSTPLQAEALGTEVVQGVRVQLRELIARTPLSQEIDRAHATLSRVQDYFAYITFLGTQAAPELAPIQERFHPLQSPATLLRQDLAILMGVRPPPLIARAQARHSAIDLRNATDALVPRDTVLGLTIDREEDLFSPQHTRENVRGIRENLAFFIEQECAVALNFASELVFALRRLATEFEVLGSRKFKNDALVELPDLTANVEKMSVSVAVLADSAPEELNASDWAWVKGGAARLNIELANLRA